MYGQVISHFPLHLILTTTLLGSDSWIIFPNLQMRKVNFHREIMSRGTHSKQQSLGIPKSLPGQSLISHLFLFRASKFPLFVLLIHV